jgi:hypothetical protein
MKSTESATGPAFVALYRWLLRGNRSSRAHCRPFGRKSFVCEQTDSIEMKESHIETEEITSNRSLTSESNDVNLLSNMFRFWDNMSLNISDVDCCWASLLVSWSDGRRDVSGIEEFFREVAVDGQSEGCSPLGLWGERRFS